MPSGADDSAAQVREVFDAFGGERERLRKDVSGRVSFEIHRRFPATSPDSPPASDPHSRRYSS